MKKNLKFILMTSWIFLSRAYDAYCTSLHTPDLSQEANPLVRVLGMGWTPLLATVGLLTLLVVITYYMATYRPYAILPKEKGMTFIQVATYLYLGRKEHWSAVLYQIPLNIRHIIQYSGEVLSRCIAFAGVVSTIMWLGIHYSPFYRSIHSLPLVYGVLITGCFVLSVIWSYQQYKIYKSVPVT